jgi:hypothetical protein
MYNSSTAVAVAPQGLLARFDQSMELDHEALRRLRVIAVVGLVALNGADLVLTRRLLTVGGIEANPLMALFIAGGWGIAIKLALPVLIGARNLRAPLRRSVVLALCWMCVAYSGVVLWNTHLLAVGLPAR